MNIINSRKSIYKSAIIATSIILLTTFIFPPISGAETIQYIYDDTRQLTTVIYGDGITVEYTYDDSGNRITKTITLPGNMSPAPSSLDSGDDGSNQNISLDDDDLTIRKTRNEMVFVY